MFAQHVMKLLLFACALVSCCAAAPASDTQLTTNEELATDGELTTTKEEASECQFTITDKPSVSLKDETSTPPVFFTADFKGKIVRCLQKDPAQCEMFFENASDHHGPIIAHMNYIYIVGPHTIFRCQPTIKHSCKSIHKTMDVFIYSMTIGDGKIFVGLKNGTVLVSDLYQTNRPRTLHTFTSKENKIFSLKHVDGWLYVGLENGSLLRCSTTEDNACTLRYNMKSIVQGLAYVSDTIIGITAAPSLWNCSHKDQTKDCVSVALDYGAQAITVFNGDLYFINNWKKSIFKCIWGNDLKCSIYASNKKAHAMAFVYGTHLLQPQYKNENKACTCQRHLQCPPYVTYYETQQRAALQVHVKDGKLHNSEGALVDTRDADEGHSGPAAIFAMSPDGTILLSNTHKKEGILVSSLFAGSPVSGAGEMIVVDGVIKKIMACSDHYLPDLELNEQVIQSLTSKGYRTHPDCNLQQARSRYNVD